MGGSDIAETGMWVVAAVGVGKEGWWHLCWSRACNFTGLVQRQKKLEWEGGRCVFFVIVNKEEIKTKMWPSQMRGRLFS